MNDVTNCPVCEGETKHEYTNNEWNNEIRHVRTCSECSAEYTVSYGDPVIKDVFKS